MRSLQGLFLFASMSCSLLRARSRSGRTSRAAAGESFTLTVKVQLVVEAVEVKDKNGKPIEGLTAKDFTLTEDGVAQTIRFCEHQDL